MIPIEPGGSEQWKKDTPCKGNVVIFIGPEYERPTDMERRASIAKAICDTCPVIHRCFEYAVNMDETIGVWGGVNFDTKRYGTKAKRKLYIDAIRQARPAS
jgi:WhiB family transcriptional regulator, redox-sensing transcriptional regulator